MYRGFSKASLQAAREYILARIQQKPIFLMEIAEKYGVSRRYVASAFRAILREEDVVLPTTPPEIWVNRFSDELKLPEVVKDEAISICQEVYDFIHGRDPIGSAAAAIYIACIKHRLHKTQNGIRITQQELSKVTRCSEATIRNRYKMITRLLPKISEASP